MNIATIDSQWLSKNLKLNSRDAAITSVLPIAEGKGMIGSLYCIHTVKDSYVVKLSPGKESLWYPYLRKMQPFKREAEAYRLLKPHRLKLGNAVPECYWADYAPDGTGVIVMENLLKHKAVMKSVTDVISMAHCRAVLHSAARMHALYAAIRNENKTSAPYNWMYSGRSRALADIFATALEQTHTIIAQPHVTGRTQKHLDRILSFDVRSMLRHAHQKSRLVSFCHGDLWLNNVLFLKAQRTTRACIIDWQFASWGNPLVDIAFFLFSSLDAELRHKVTRPLLKFYHTELICFSPQLKSYTLEDCHNDYACATSYGTLMTLASLESFILSGRPEDARPLIRRALQIIEEAGPVIR